MPGNRGSLGLLVLGPGLVSGQPSYITELDALTTGALGPETWLGSFVDAIAVDPYAKDAETLGELLDSYAAVTNLPIWITEFGWDSPDQHERAVWLSHMMIAIEEWSAVEDGRIIPVACHFCFHDYAGFGLMKEGAATESYAAFFRCSESFAAFIRS